MASVLRNLPAALPTAGALYPAVRGGLSGLLDTLAMTHGQGEVGVLGIVFATAGSTYQKSGALVLLDRTGMRHGAISGGCLEPELEERARRVNGNRSAETIDFDTRSDEDLIFGSGTGCRGRIHLLLLPQSPGAPLTAALAKLHDGGKTLEIALVTGGPQLGCGSATLAGETWHWGRDGQRATRPAATEPGNTLVRLSIRPPPRILLFGTGPETATLNLFMRTLGWTVSAVEHRGRWLKFAHAAGLQDIVELPPDEAAPLWRQQQAHAAIAMTHNYALDMEHLRQCADSDLSYIGLLGPAARRDSMLTELGAEHTRRLEGRLHAPVGLTLGGRGPEPLALAIVAELQQHFTQQAHAP